MTASSLSSIKREEALSRPHAHTTAQPGQSDTGYGSEAVALLTARESWLIYRALGPTGESPPTEGDRLIYVEAVKKLKAAAQEASA